MANNFRDLGRLENAYGTFDEDATCDPDELQPPSAPQWNARELARAFDAQCRAEVRAAVALCLLRQAARDLTEARADPDVVAWYLGEIQRLERGDA
jgi:hypothetical protein